MKKFVFLAGLAIGVVVGSRLGRGPYDSLERTARQVASDPEVQRRAGQAKDAAGKVAHDAAETVKAKAPEVASAAGSAVSGAASAAKEKVSSSSTDADEPIVAEDSTAVAGGDAEVGEDKPLSS